MLSKLRLVIKILKVKLQDSKGNNDSTLKGTVSEGLCTAQKREPGRQD